MHGLINRAIQCFVADTYGADAWVETAREAELGFSDFESMLTYEATITPRILDAASAVLDRPRSELMEDLGTYLVSNPNVEAVRRLLRFGGVDFVDFLSSLDDLPDRARLAVSDLHLPPLELREHTPTDFSLTCDSPVDGYGYVMMGILRVMADDYGTLALLEHAGRNGAVETIMITLVETEFAEGRSFDLGARAI